MDTDAAPRRKIVPLWVWFVVGAVVLYLALWGATFVAGLKYARKFRKDLESSPGGNVVSLRSFDPAAAQPELPPDDKHQYIFLGNFSCPCPLVIRVDVVVYLRKGGLAVQESDLWLGNRWKQTGHRCYWSY
jgi:hypothetical protein